MLLLVTASLIVAAWNASLSFWDEPSFATASMTATESKSRGLWVASLRGVPAELTLPKQTVHIDSAWVEFRSHRTEKLWGPSECRLGGYSISFTLAEGSLDHDYFFVPGDSGAGVTECGGTLYTMDLKDSADVNTLQLSLISSWQDSRSKNISFVPYQE
jgi:hypothetical protein